MSKKVWPLIYTALFIGALAFMFDPITIGILAVLGGMVALAVIYIAYLTITEIMNWFHSNQQLSKRDKRIIGVTIKESMQSGQYVIVQGVFDSRTKKILEGRRISSHDLDRELKRRHRFRKRVTYKLY